MATRTASFDFTDNIVIVTGGASGIGLQVSTDFVRSGAHVVIVGRDQRKLDAARAGLPAGSVTTVRADISDQNQVRDLVDSTVRDHGGIDVVISNAAQFIPGDITDVSADQWADLRSTNIDGFFYLAQQTLPVLAQRGGTFIATSSVSGLRGDWNQAVYNASKGAVSLFVQSLALDWAPRGVRVNGVAPSVTNTEALADITGNDTIRPHFENRVALGRLAETEDIAPAFLFLASDAARYVNGVILPVDGGTSASTGQAHIAA
ncbi:3-oxoacyl-ACP reductase [Rhodococcoides trifolii]|uniref:3-oxoacyl-ACP reductase n=1 Tax=Rhodococcoides trifolii TaxID=908250 RepID=A0A917G5X1_9NOCA|nr:SDR family oxidoreductase [Rhodococcus trifolii]GGG24462.1 3-oxoacyl-ACP reductase [Rhodococcus trifolii]